MEKKHRWLLGIVIIIAMPLVWIVVSFIARGIAMSQQPTFFGINIGNRYQPVDFQDDPSDYYYWTMKKYKEHDRPYVFDKTQHGKYLDATVCKIHEFYGQDMAMVLQTRRMEKTVGVVVAAKCKKEERDNVANEISATICRKHKNVLVNKLDPMQNLMLTGFIRRPALHFIITPQTASRLVCSNESFDAFIMGVDLQQVRKPVIESKAKRDDSNIRPIISKFEEDLYEASQRQNFDSIGQQIMAEDIIKWQVKHQTIEEMYEERLLRKYNYGRERDVCIGDWGETIDVNSSLVYVFIISHDYDKLIAEEDVKLQQDERWAEQQRMLEKERVRQKNASAL